MERVLGNDELARYLSRQLLELTPVSLAMVGRVSRGMRPLLQLSEKELNGRVFQELLDEAIEDDDRVAARRLLHEAMTRVGRNVEVIKDRLRAMDYPARPPFRQHKKLPFAVPLILEVLWATVGEVDLSAPNYAHIDFWDNKGLTGCPDVVKVSGPHDWLRDDSEESFEYSGFIDAPFADRYSEYPHRSFLSYLRKTILHAGGFPGFVLTHAFEPYRLYLTCGLEPF